MKFVAPLTVLIAAAAANAAIIAPGGNVFLPTSQGAITGSIVASTTSPFTNANFNGSLYSAVISGDPTNIHGGYTFIYVLTNNSSSANDLQRLTVNGFAGYITDFSWVLGGGVAPIVQDRSIGAGDVAGFQFGSFVSGYSRVTPGSSTNVLVVHTDSATYGLNPASVIDGLTAVVPAYSPLPTPGASALFGIGLLASARRRR